MARRRLILVALLLCTSPSWAKRRLEVADLTASPPLEGQAASRFVWVPGTSRVSFLSKDADRTILVSVDARTGAREVLVDPADFAGVTLEEYQWSPDGSALLLPGSNGLALFNLGKRSLERLTSTPDEYPSFSPDGSRLAYLREGNLFVLDLQSRKEVALTREAKNILSGHLDWVYEEELSSHLGRAYEWSPDSRSIALLRLDQSRVPVYPLVDFLGVPHPSTTEQRYPNPGDPNSTVQVRVVDLEGRERAREEIQAEAYVVPDLYWLPDSRRVAYGVLSRDQTHLEMRVLDTASGTTTVLVEERDPFWVNVPDRVNASLRSAALYFLKDGRFLWLSERSGFRHVYLGTVGSTSLQPLTRGDWMVDNVLAVDERNGFMYLTATKAGVRERPVYRLRIEGGGMAPVTPERGLHAGELSPNGQLLLDTSSDAESLPRTSVLEAGGRFLRLLDEARSRLDEFDLPRTEFVEISAADGTPLVGRITKPLGFNPRAKYPAIVQVYGGPHVQLVRNEFHRPGVASVLASRGFVVFSLDNRGSWGRGHAFESGIFRSMGRLELQDQLQGVAYLKGQKFVDPARIGITGWSYGGYMTLYALTHAPGVFRSGVAGAPVTDWRLYDSIYTERYMRTPQDNADGYATSSPLQKAGDLRAQLLLLHGTADDNVHLYNTLNFVHELVKAGRRPELFLAPGQRHGFSDPSAQRARDEATVEFFERTLRP